MPRRVAVYSAHSARLLLGDRLGVLAAAVVELPLSTSSSASGPWCAAGRRGGRGLRRQGSPLVCPVLLICVMPPVQGRATAGTRADCGGCERRRTLRTAGRKSR
eukprot:2513072-Rhodomonas_salina.1